MEPCIYSGEVKAKKLILFYRDVISLSDPTTRLAEATFSLSDRNGFLSQKGSVWLTFPAPSPFRRCFVCKQRWVHVIDGELCGLRC